MRVLIVGWYGTETVGDKAILAGIFLKYRERYPDAQFIIASIYPLITARTLKELQIEAKIIATYSFEFIKYAAVSNVVVMGGGPLMDMEALSIPLWTFIIARLFRRKRVIYGCGLGPLKQPRYLKTVSRILKLSTEVQLRDSESIALAKTMVNRDDYILSGDPSLWYLQAIRPNFQPEKRHTIALFIRDWPYEYAKHLTPDEFQQLKMKFEENLAAFLVALVSQLGADYEIVFYPMHCFIEGDDDRIYARGFVSKYLQTVNARVQEHPSSVNSTVQAMLNAALCICMRFHSVVFAHTLRCQFMALDYTSGGKIKGFLKDNNALEYYHRIEDIAQNPAALMSKIRN